MALAGLWIRRGFAQSIAGVPEIVVGLLLELEVGRRGDALEPCGGVREIVASIGGGPGVEAEARVIGVLPRQFGVLGFGTLEVPASVGL